MFAAMANMSVHIPSCFKVFEIGYDLVMRASCSSFSQHSRHFHTSPRLYVLIFCFPQAGHICADASRGFAGLNNPCQKWVSLYTVVCQSSSISPFFFPLCVDGWIADLKPANARVKVWCHYHLATSHCYVEVVRLYCECGSVRDF